MIRTVVVAVLLLTGAVAPALACPEMAMPGMSMPGMAAVASIPDTDRLAVPPTASSCDMACLACLVQPVPLRIGTHGGWSRTAHYLPAVVQLSARSTPPELPPPRYLPL